MVREPLHIIRNAFILIPLAITGILFWNPNVAQGTEWPDCQLSNSAYCSNSWQGGYAFAHWINQQSPQTLYQDEGSIEQIHANPAHLLIWPNPPAVSLQTVLDILASGSSILVFDESDTTLEWYRNLFDKRAITIDSPAIQQASHINGSQALPVIPPTRDFIRDLEFAGDTSQWQIAFNHPSPIVVHEQGHTSFHLVFAFRNPHTENSGTAVIIRDESTWTELMMNTLDNSKFLHAILDSMCPAKQACTIHLYEPAFQWSAPVIPDEPESPEWQETIQKSIEQSRQKWTDWMDSNEPLFKQIPWKEILISILLLWTIIAVIAIFPLTRTKSG